MSDYLTRNPTFNASPSSVYDELFVMRTIGNFTQVRNLIRAGAAMPPGPIDYTFVSNISVESSMSANWSFGNGNFGDNSREGGYSNPPSIDQSDSTISLEQTPVGGDKILSPAYKDFCGCSPQEVVICLTSNIDQLEYSLFSCNLPPLNWCSLTGNTDQSRSRSRAI